MTREDIFQIIKNNTVEILSNISHDQIKINDRLKDLGANSIDRMEIVTKTMEDLRVKIPLVELGRVNNIEGLIDILYEEVVKRV